ncbi:MAG: hypothetical protein K2O34_09305 [Acetatifactor sp.]|nr:hypothetical protein [Acetatifactor sp.]
MSGWEPGTAYADITWDEENQCLVVVYKNGAVHYYQWNGKEFCPETEEPDR